MADALFVAVVIGFFVLALLFVRGCEVLTSSASELTTVDDEELMAR